MRREAAIERISDSARGIYITEKLWQKEKDSRVICCLFQGEGIFAMGVAKNKNVLGVYVYYNIRIAE